MVKDSTLPLQGMGSVSGWRTINKILHAAQFRQKINNKKMSSLRKTRSLLQQNSVLPGPASDSPLFALAEEQVGQEATLQPWLLKTPARLPWSPRWPFTGLGSLSPAAM